MLVACAIMVVLLLAIAGLHLASLRSSHKAAAHSDAYRAAMLALERLKLEFRGSTITTPAAAGGAPSDQVTYRYPQVIAGILQVNSRGEPLWAGTATVDIDAQGRLIRTDASGEQRVLAALGRAGTVTFFRSADRMLEVTVVADSDDPGQDTTRDSRYEVKTVLHIANQSLP